MFSCFSKNKIWKGLWGLVLGTSLCLALDGCTPFWRSDVQVKKYETKEDASSDQDAEEESSVMDWEDALSLASEYYENMTMEERVGQLFVVNLEQLDNRKGNYYEFQRATETMRNAIAKYHVGGVILFSRNLKNRQQVTAMNQKLQEASRTPLFICVDEEGGDVARIASKPEMGHTIFPSAEEIGKTKDDQYTYEMAKTIGTEIGELGFNVDFAPVADVKTSELNAEIGNRSFGDDPEKVSDHVNAFVQGLNKVNICATLKHFPGQGSSKGDTHKNSVDIDSGIARLRKTDFLPFETGIASGADFIMMSHISVSKVTESSVPASLSDLMMQTILRQELGFEKVIITDAFDMASITEHYTSGEAAYNAVKAGADVVLMPQNLDEAYQEILAKVKSGKLTEKRLEDSVLRILAVKIQRELLTREQVLATPAPTPSYTPAPTSTPKKTKKPRKNR